MRILATLLLVAPLALAACGQAPAGDTATASPASAATGTHFRYSIDDETFDVADDDVMTSAYASGELKIFAGGDSGPSLVLTIPDIAACPCAVPAGSTTAGNVLDQGAVSLQNHPERGNGLNSWYVGQPGTPPADAITVTDIGTLHDGERIVRGRFRATVLRTESNGDGPGNRDYVVVGDFAVRHTPRGGEF